MHICVRSFDKKDIPAMIAIWNRVVEDGMAFPQEAYLTEESGIAFFSAQTHTAVAEDADTGRVLGLYILHPNNIGRCGHICNTSYAVDADHRGIHIGRMLVEDSLRMGKAHGFSILQFNAVVASNHSARHLYESIGFRPLGVIPGGFRMKDGSFEDICPYYILL